MLIVVISVLLLYFEGTVGFVDVLMQTCILYVGVPQFHKLNEVAENAARICKATHADPRCVASSVMVAVVIALMLQVTQYCVYIEILHFVKTYV